MVNSKKWADEIIGNIQRVTAAAKEAAAATSAAGVAPASPSAQMSPEAIADALAEHLKNDNATTQAIAIRINSLSTKYPTRAA